MESIESLGKGIGNEGVDGAEGAGLFESCGSVGGAVEFEAFEGLERGLNEGEEI
jgi:hypothetical protein